MTWEYYLALAVTLIVGFGLGLLVLNTISKKNGEIAREKSSRLIDEANRESANILKTASLDAKEEYFKSRKLFESETEKTRDEQSRRTSVLDQRETNLHKKVTFVDHKEAKLEKIETSLKEKEEVLQKDKEQASLIVTKQQEVLEQVAGMTAENAKQTLMDNMLSEAKLAAAKSLYEIKSETERRARKDSQNILSLAIHRYASEHVAETSVSVVDLPNDDMKGRIIGREGRNIRAFELSTGVDVIIDDTPEAVIISGFDPVRREVACIALRKLIKDGRIHPGRIEETVEKVSKEMDEKLNDIGEQSCIDLDLQNVDHRLYYHIGRLHYRTSYGQNLLIHSKEVAALCSTIASEIGLDPVVAKRCGFLHDIGKATDHEVEGPHAEIGGRLARKFKEKPFVVNAIEGHHHDIEAISPYTWITSAADAVSASRPGARRESFDNYIKRLENLERIAESYEGVEKSFAIQAGREIRILVDSSQVSDAESALMSEEICKKIEGELEYPGQIKVMVLRETRSVSYAK
ncbi:ribonuclease Y [bacterium]|jgi:ribonuclease Y|nr:ribonuclease Y [bacterium]MBT4291579.1 ribonuclease Y [bacterium]